MAGFRKKRRQPSSIKTQTSLLVADQELPIDIFREKRNNVRISLGKNAVLYRVPHFLDDAQIESQLRGFIPWLEKQVKAGNTQHYNFREYQDGELLQVGERSYTIHITEAPSQQHKAQLLNGNQIILQLSDKVRGPERWKSVAHLLSRLIGKHFKPEIERRIHELNEMHFKQPINSIRLKYNYTNSGSCSKAGNINLSTRLLFAPKEVQDYVIIHELAHLIELNHSSRFWALVEAAMPNYKEQEAWLKQHSRKLGF
jgi:predicted metal-dependent hydrolase